MKTSQFIKALSVSHQAASCALNCEKMLPSIAKFDESEAKPASSVFEKAIATIYIFSVSSPATLKEYADLKNELEALWPETKLKIILLPTPSMHLVP